MVSPSSFTTTFASTGIPGSVGDNGPAVQLNSPFKLAIGPDGSPYLSDPGAKRVRKI